MVLDLHIPGMTGMEILKKIRAEQLLAKTRVILTTADERQAETLTEDTYTILRKPVSPGQLRELALRISN